MGENLAPRAYSVKRLAELWGCSPKQVYNLIDQGKLRAFSIGKRGLRVTVEEVERCERERELSRTGTATSSSAGGGKPGLPTYAMKILAGA